MADPVVDHKTDKDKMARLREGMPVYDNAGKKVGTISAFYMGADADAGSPGAMPATSAGAEFADTSLAGPNFVAIDDPDGHIPEVMRNRMRRSGFVTINAGLLHRNRYALREHIAAVDDERVDLNIPGSGLIKA